VRPLRPVTGGTCEPGAQFHPATAHWKTPAGEIGWLRLLQGPRVNARAENGVPTISAIGDSTFRLAAPSLDPRTIQRDLWVLPGLTVRVDADALSSTVAPGDGYVDIVYLEATKIVLRFPPAATP
jgi:hypothetical protein